MAVHLMNSYVQRDTFCSQGPSAAPACPGEALGEGQAASLALQPPAEAQMLPDALGYKPCTSEHLSQE